MVKFSNPTEYMGRIFRSRLEADFARWFDNRGIAWVYEPEGYKLSNGECYLPDFFLPAQKAYFECKGVMLAQDERKITGLAKDSGTDVFVGLSIFRSKPLLQLVDAFNGNYKIQNGDIVLARCLSCDRPYLMSASGDFTCRACGNYNGNAGFTELEYYPGY